MAIASLDLLNSIAPQALGEQELDVGPNRDEEGTEDFCLISLLCPRLALKAKMAASNVSGV